jgi:hypothetical protein
MGADGGTNATSGVVPELTRRLYDLTRAGDLAQAVPLQLRLIELFDAMLYSADFPEGFRAAVELRGFDIGASRQPLSDAQQIDRQALQQVLRCILADFGLNEPGHACAVRTGNIAQDKAAQAACSASAYSTGSEEQKIAQVTQAVLAELGRRGKM